MASLTGTTLGRYRVGEVLGVGGFGAVYRGRDEGLDADVAIKVLADHSSLSPEARERFLGEGRLLRRVEHPGVITVHDVGETSDMQPYLVLQYAEGGSLADRLAGPTEPVTLAEIADIASQLASAMSAVHDAGIVHRDLAPDNIFITGPENAGGLGGSTLLKSGEKLLVGDLGLAKDIIAGSGITSGAGTEGFAAPEQRTAAGTVSPAADIFGASALLRFIADEAGTPEVQNVVAKAVGNGLRDDPSQRPQSASAWLDHVRRGLESPATPAGSPSGPKPWLAVLSVVAIVSGGLLWLANGGSAAPGVTLFDGAALADGWRPQSFGVAGDAIFSPPDPTVRLQEFDAVSIMTDTAVTFENDQFLVVQFADVASVDGLSYRVNNAAGDELDVCIVDGTDMIRQDGNSFEIVVPAELLGIDGMISRIVVQNQGGPERTLQLAGIHIYDDVSPVPTAEVCAST